MPHLALFFNANKLYGRGKCQLISFSLPDARSPHQLGLQLPIARYLGKDDHITTFAVMTECDLSRWYFKQGGMEVRWSCALFWTGRSFAVLQMYPHQRPRCATLNVGE